MGKTIKNEKILEKIGKYVKNLENLGKNGNYIEKMGKIWKNKEAFAWRMKWRRAGMGNIFCMRKIIMNLIY